MTPLDAQRARYLLQAGKRPRRSLDRLLKGAHRAGFLVLPGKRIGETSQCLEPQPDAVGPEGQGTVTRQGRRFGLEHRDYPKGLIVLDAAGVTYEGPESITTYELALELKQGPALLLERVLNLVALQPGLIPARLTDAQRALQAAGALVPESRSAPGHHLSIDSRWQDLGLAHLKALAAQLQHYEPLAAESLDAEGVHQMRVTTRRLREALRTFAPVLPAAEVAALTTDLRWLTGLLGEVRDLDVQLQRLLRYQAPPSNERDAGLQPYRDHLQKRQRRAHRALIDAIDQSRMQQIHRCIQSLIHAALAGTDPAPSIAEAAPRTLQRQLRRVVKCGRRASAGCEASKLHKLRIEAKRLRYFLEYVRPVGGPAIEAGIAALTRQQDILGEHQDACIAAFNLQRYRKTAGITGRERKLIARLVEREIGNVERARSQFRVEWPAFVRASRTLAL